MLSYEVIRDKDDLHRERWRFSLVVDTRGVVYFEDYATEVRQSKRHKWTTASAWHRLFKRSYTLAVAPLPADVETEARDYFAGKVRELPIVR